MERPDSIQRVFFDPHEYVNENCPHCKAEWGHFIQCPLINRTAAEARSRQVNPTEADRIAAHALGITLDELQHI